MFSGKDLRFDGCFPERESSSFSGAIFPSGIPSGTYPNVSLFRRFWDTFVGRVAAQDMTLRAITCAVAPAGCGAWHPAYSQSADQLRR